VAYLSLKGKGIIRELSLKKDATYDKLHPSLVCVYSYIYQKKPTRIVVAISKIIESIL
jgi:hypothetical protein